MNNNPRFAKKRLGQIVAAAVLTAIGGSALAGDFSLDNNQVAYSGASSGTVTVDASGVATAATYTGGALPNIGFTLVNNSNSTGTYYVRLRMKIDSQTDNDSVTMRLGVVKVEVTNGTINSVTMVTNGQANYETVTVNATKQSGSSTTNLSTETLPTKASMIQNSGASVTIRVDEVVNSLIGSNALFQDIVGGFMLNDHYDYRIGIEQVSAPTTLRVGHEDGGTYTAFPRLLNACQGFTVLGTMTVGTPSASLIAATAVAESGCVVDDGGSGEEDDDEEETPNEPDPIVNEEDLTNIEDDLAELEDELNNLPEEGPVSQEVIDTVTTVIENTNNIADQLLNAVAPPTQTPEAPPPVINTANALTSLVTVSNTAATSATVATRTENQQTATTLINQNVNLVTTTATVMTALVTQKENSEAPQVLNDTQQTQVQNIATNLVNSVNTLATTTTSAAVLDQLAQSTAATLEAQARLNVPATPAQVEVLVDVSVKLATARLQQAITASNPEAPAPTEAEVRQILSTNPALLETVVASSLPIPPTTTRSVTERTTAVNNIAASSGITLSQAAANRAAVATSSNIDPGAVQVGGQSVLTILQNLFSSSLVQLTFIDDNGRVGSTVAVTDASQTITVDAATGTVVVRLPNETYTGVIVAVRAVPNTVPNGITFRRDGRGMIVSNGVAVELATTAANYLGFIAALENMGYAYTQRNDASFSLNIGGGQRFVGAFAYNNLTGKNLDTCGAVSFDTPTGSVNAASYSFKAKCANGIEQNILPYPSNANFYNSVAAAGLTVTTDRNTGIITISGVGRVKPSFFVSTPTTAETAYHTANKDANGLAFQAADINGDGLVDYKVISATGVQVMFGVR